MSLCLDDKPEGFSSAHCRQCGSLQKRCAPSSAACSVSPVQASLSGTRTALKKKRGGHRSSRKRRCSLPGNIFIHSGLKAQTPKRARRRISMPSRLMRSQPASGMARCNAA
jgi:hypothetical protein